MPDETRDRMESDLRSLVAVGQGCPVTVHQCGAIDRTLKSLDARIRVIAGVSAADDDEDAPRRADVTVRQAARQGACLSGAGALALEGALRQAEADILALQSQLEQLEVDAARAAWEACREASALAVLKLRVSKGDGSAIGEHRILINGFLNLAAADIRGLATPIERPAPKGIAPTCPTCSGEMTLRRWDRPGGPPGNGWGCDKCHPLLPVPSHKP